MAIGAPITLGVWLALGLIGRRQSRQLGGTTLRLIWVSAACALLATLPMWIVLALADIPGVLDSEDRLVFIVTTTATLLSVLQVARWLVPLSVAGSALDLPLLGDAPLLARIAELAAKQGIAPPPARVMASASASMRTLAMITGLTAPTLIVTDGIIHRLDPGERDAILGHELGHLSTRTLWLLVASTPIGIAAAAASTPVVPWFVVFAMVLALPVGLRRIIGRPIEMACDERGAACTSHAAMAVAVAKIHAVELPRKDGLVPWLFHATSTHPSLEVRRASLRARAPKEAAERIAVDVARVRAHRIGAAVALAVWLCAVAATFALAWTYGEVMAVLLAALALTPFVLGVVVLVEKTRRMRALARGARRWQTMAIPIVALVAIAGTFGALIALGSVMFLPLMMMSLCGLLGSLGLIIIERPTRALRHAVSNAYLGRDYQRVLSAAAGTPVKDPALRNDIALAHAAVGERAEAVRLFQALIADAPRMALPYVNLASVQLVDDAEAALETARAVAALLPEHPTPRILQARALRILGDLDAAWQVVTSAVEIDDAEGIAHAVAAQVAADRGDGAAADEHLARARELAPGHPALLVAEAVIAGHREAAGLDEAIAAVEACAHNNQLAFIDAEIALLHAQRGSQARAGLPAAGAHVVA